MLAKINSSALFGVEAFRIKIEVNIANGTGYFITGQPDDAVKESLSRIDVALKSNGYHMPRTKISVNLAPANIRKEGTAYDLPIAIGILLASEQEFDLGKFRDFIVIGELGLDGSVYPVRGALCMAYQAKRDGFKGIILPSSNATEAALIKGVDVYGVKHLAEVIEFIRSDCSLQPNRSHAYLPSQKVHSTLDFKDVKGQHQVKRGMEIAAAGGHNAIIIGPPGIGKTMLAKRLPSILPPLTFAEALETTRIYSVVNSGEALTGLITERPFRNPHHTSSDISLAGGGSIPMPGEISLAHNGVLFLDELPEFKRTTIEVLRQPLEERKVFIARAKAGIEYPAAFQLIASMNPCLCGYFNHPFRICTCSKRAIYWYRRKVSGPLLERIDLHIEAESLSINDLIESEPGESSETIRQGDKKKLKTSIDWIMVKPPKNLQQFKDALQKEKISLIIRQNYNGIIYGLTYIDHTTKSVFNGSDIGKEYSSKAILEKCGQSQSFPLQETIRDKKVSVKKIEPTPLDRTHDLRKDIGKTLDIIINPTENLSNVPYELRKQKKKKIKSHN